jgi:hypothetical protein
MPAPDGPRDWLLQHAASRGHFRPPRVELKDLPLPVEKIRAIREPVTKAVQSVYYVGAADGANAGLSIGLEAGGAIRTATSVVIGAALVFVWLWARFLAWWTMPPVERGSAAGRFVVAVLIFAFGGLMFAWGARVNELVAWCAKRFLG